MQDTELYRHLLGLVTPWIVERVELNLQAEHVDVWVGYPKGQRFPCVQCQEEYSVYDHQDRA